MKNIKYLIAGDSALIVSFGEEIKEDINRKVLAFCKRIEKEKINGIVELLPSYRDVCIFYNPLTISIKQIKVEVDRFLKESLSLNEENEVKNVIEVPVLYGGEFGPDLEDIAKYCNLTQEKVIELHSSREYRVYMIGFSPGFPYLGGLSEKLYIPRREVPIPKMPKNSVELGGKQTGILTIPSPSGWWCIGRTPLDFYKINSSISILVKPGDYIKFKVIDEKEYNLTLIRNKQGEDLCLSKF